MKATLLREKLTELIATYGDVDLKVNVPCGEWLEEHDIRDIHVPIVRDFEKEDKGHIYLD